jgi:archaellum component FlaG (FlaF/FlaG flagellin family)
VGAVVSCCACVLVVSAVLVAAAVVCHVTTAVMALVVGLVTVGMVVSRDAAEKVVGGDGKSQGEC